MAAIEVDGRESPAPAADWRVMVVEDNPTIAALHKRIVDSVPYLRTVHVAGNGEHAFAALPTVAPDLIILDLTMIGGDGLALLRSIRNAGIPIDVIVVTASRGGRIVQEVTHLGVIDYLVKPFTPQRLRIALSAFAMRHRTLTRSPELSQADVDLVRAGGSGRQRRRLPKGLKSSTLASVLAALDGCVEALTADEMGRQVGVARVTARRYLEYLELMGVVVVSQRPGGPGRPSKRYRRRAQAA